MYTGGLHFMRSPELVIAQETVTLGVDQVNVEYVFYNTSKLDIVETIVSPIPMQTTVDGLAIESQATNRAITKSGRDISNILKNLGVSYDPITAMHNIDISPNRDSIRAKLIAAKIIDKKDETAEWFIKTFYYWQQKFPAGSKITINQSYKPSLVTKNIKVKTNTGILNMPVNALKKLYNLTVHWTLEDQITAKNLQTMLETNNPQIKDFCPSIKDYQAIIGPQESFNLRKPTVETKELHYDYLADDIWATPINHFTLRILSPDDMHPMLCWSGDFKRQGKNTLIFEADNFVPLQNLSVLFVEK